MSTGGGPASSDVAAPVTTSAVAASGTPPAVGMSEAAGPSLAQGGTPASGGSSPFAMLGDPTAAACEGDACLIA